MKSEILRIYLPYQWILLAIVTFIGDKESSKIAQALMDQITQDKQNAAAFQDNLRIFSASFESLLEHLKELMTWLKNAGRTANKEK